MTTEHKPTLADELRDAVVALKRDLLRPGDLSGGRTIGKLMFLAERAAAELDRRVAPGTWSGKCPAPTVGNHDGSIESCLRSGDCGCVVSLGARIQRVALEMTGNKPEGSEYVLSPYLYMAVYEHVSNRLPAAEPSDAEVTAAMDAMYSRWREQRADWQGMQKAKMAAALRAARATAAKGE